MKTIIIALALLTIGCKKTEAPTVKEVEPVVVAATVEPIEYLFAQSVSYSNIQLTDMDGVSVGSVNNYSTNCTPAYFTLENDLEYRLTINAKNNANVFNVLLWEGIVKSSDSILSYSKTGGSKNMFNDGSCGIDIYVVK